jgi:hypothetical protein
MTLAGLPHSEISGSMRACRSPKHIAACHVLHRLSVPRHPPSTLSNLTIKCLDLMRSADAMSSDTARASSSTTRIQLSRNADREDRRWAPRSSRSVGAHRGYSRSRLLRRGRWLPEEEGNDCTSTFLPRSWDSLVELIGIEPTTPCLQSRCSPN